MNRSFLILLMVGTALMIAVIGNRPRPVMPGYMPWEVKVLDNGNTRIFGITLGKTRIQDANQILSSFPDNRIERDAQRQPGLYAVYEQLNLGGFLVRLELEYDLDAQQLQMITGDVAAEDTIDLPQQLDDDVQMQLLNSTVRSIRYIPQVDYTEALLLQHFGQPEQREHQGNHHYWRYPAIGLSIDIDDQGPDIFSYHRVEPPPTTQDTPAAEPEAPVTANQPAS